MYAGQRMVASDGYEVALFPMPYLRMSQDEGGDYSHQGTYNIDILGWDANGRVYNAPMYAPCTLKLKAFENTYAGGHLETWESVNMVHLANGALDYLTIGVGHDNNPPVTTIGATVNQGDLFYHTGTFGNVTGDHCHTCCGQGHYTGWVTRPPYNHQDLANRIHYWDAVFVNDTVISQGFHHNWLTWTQPTPPPPVERESNFPWFIYFRKRRNGL